MWRKPALAAGIAAITLTCCVPAGAARTPARACAAFNTATLRVSRVRANAGCTRAEGTLRVLLRHGVKGLPHRRHRSRRWSCARHGVLWSCRRARRRISFRVRVAKNAQPQPPATPAPPAPKSAVELCADRWNADAAAVSLLGYHLYLDHAARRAWIFELPGSTRCAVIASVPVTDPEYGADGAVTRASGTGWDWMNLVPELGDRAALQAQAPGYANATVLPTGELALP